MGKVIITQALVDRILELLIAQTSFSRESIYSEIQDNFQSLFISISIDNFPEEELAASFKRTANVLNQEMPMRDDAYSWVVGLKRAGEIVDSCFGGNLGAPNWGV